MRNTIAVQGIPLEADSPSPGEDIPCLLPNPDFLSDLNTVVKQTCRCIRTDTECWFLIYCATVIKRNAWNWVRKLASITAPGSCALYSELAYQKRGIIMWEGRIIMQSVEFTNVQVLCSAFRVNYGPSSWLRLAASFYRPRTARKLVLWELLLLTK
jgi:hypothetical protein